jgi:murein L,D-transpeptidase YafK
LRASALALLAFFWGGLLAPLALAGESVKADKVIVVKSERRMILFRDKRVLRAYRIALGFAPRDHKARAGDGRTPEGRYVLDWRNPRSSFYRALHISYPNESDRQQARARGLNPGGDIMIHGLPAGLEVIDRDHSKSDWTDGCVAVTNREMDEIWELVEDGTPIEIRP